MYTWFLVLSVWKMNLKSYLSFHKVEKERYSNKSYFISPDGYVVSGVHVLPSVKHRFQVGKYFWVGLHHRLDDFSINKYRKKNYYKRHKAYVRGSMKIKVQFKKERKILHKKNTTLLLEAIQNSRHFHLIRLERPFLSCTFSTNTLFSFASLSLSATKFAGCRRCCYSSEPKV